MKTGNNKILRISATVGFVLITLALILINNEPATGYEISIYTALSPFVWIFLIGSIACGISIIVQQALTKEPKEKSCWLIGLLIVMLSDFIILSLPALKGYVVYGRYDILTHIGWALDTHLYGTISPDNIYPIEHIFIVIISSIIDIPLTAIVNFIVPIFFVLYIFSIYLLSKIIFRDSQKVMLAVAASTVLPASYLSMVSPRGLATLMIPIILYLYFRISERGSLGFTILLLMLIILYPFFHPLNSLIIILGFVAMEFSKVVYNAIHRIRDGERFSIPQLMCKISLNPSLISFIVLIMWISNHYYFWNNNIRSVARWFAGELITPQITYTLGLAQKINLQLSDVVELTLKMFGHNLLYILLSLGSILVIKRKFISSPLNLRNIFILFGFFMLNSLLLFLQLFASPLFFGFQRLLFIMVSVTPIFVGFTFYEFTKEFQHQRLKSKAYFFKALFMVGIILISSIVGIYSLYPSPYIRLPNHHVTNMEMNGMNWLYSYKDTNIKTISIKMNSRFADALMGVKERTERKDITQPPTNPKGLVPDHFNYTYYQKLGDSYISNKYIPLSVFDKILHTQIYPQLNAFTKTDFKKLNHDPTVSKLYTNSELEVYFVRATRSA